MTILIVYFLGDERHPDCPLIELPPHGRLIDADALIKYVNETKEIFSEHEIMTAITARDWCDAFIEDIEEAPTVIEASEVET